jgi:chromosome partitioning protein
MKVLTFVSQKGGAGKTTLAASCGVYAQERGFRVCMIEMDKQGSLRDWHVDRTKLGKEEPDFVFIEVAKQLKPSLDAIRADFDLVVIDTKGEDSAFTSAAIGSADFCALPTRPLGVDLKACLPTVQSIMASRKPFGFILNQAPARSKRTDDTQKALATLGVVADTVMVNRLDHADAVAAGYGVTEFRKDSVAADELRSLWLWLEEKLGMQGREAIHGKAA